jgi:hypothetical protein
MLRSLGLVAIVAAATLIFVPGLFHPNKAQRFAGVDYTDYLVGFRQLTNRSPVRPESLPYGWKSNAAALTGTKGTAHLHIGWATPGAHYAGLEEGVITPKAFVHETLGVTMSAVTGSMSIGGKTWQIVTSSAGQYSLIHVGGGVTLVITGTATEAQLQVLAAALAHPGPEAVI